MSRHPFRWESLAAGLFFLAVVGHWSVREADLLTGRELSLTAAGLLIVLGLVGVAATVRPARPARTGSPAPSTTTEGTTHEDADPQS